MATGVEVPNCAVELTKSIAGPTGQERSVAFWQQLATELQRLLCQPWQLGII
jgi:hypothetical protein